MKILLLTVLLLAAMSCWRSREESSVASSSSISPQAPATESTSTPIPIVGNLVNSSRNSPQRTITVNLLNDKAVSLPPPDYPEAARRVRAKGSVSVPVLVDKEGKVVSATAVGGHPLLRSAAEQAARKATFEPLVLSGQRVTFSGIIRYEFKP